jgi:hypothetical protein
MTRTAASGKRRSANGCRALADYLQAEGWPFAEAVGSGRNGVDITGTPGLAIEHKGADEWKLETWLAQAETRPGLPIVVYQGRGLSWESLARWPSIMRTGDLVGLLRQAGYGGDR